MKIILLALLLIAAGQSYACDRINFALAVDHFNGGEYNENGPLLGCETETYAFRYMKNSHNRDAFSATRRFKLLQIHDIHIGAELGITTGYKGKLVDLAGISPWALFTVRAPLAKNISATGVFFGAGGGVVINYEF